LDRLDAMQVFVAVLDCGSLAAAARRLDRSPAAVTRAIALLERRLGARLLHRWPSSRPPRPRRPARPARRAACWW
jgi:DNA-binding transcriptional LysR family regulator